MEHVPSRGQATAPSRRLPQVLRRHPLFFYFLIAYVVTWGIGFLSLPLLRQHSLLAWQLTLSGPSVAAFLMTATTDGKAGVSRLLRRYVLWRVGVHWYLLVLVALPALQLLAFLIFPEGQAFVRRWLLQLPSYPVIYLMTLISAPLLEEPGWRGFALPRLQPRFGPLRGTLLLGVLWTFWHLPLFFLPGHLGAEPGVVGISRALVIFLIGVLALAVVFTWVFNHTRGSVLLAILLHTSIDACGPDTGSLRLSVVLWVPYIVVALLIIVATRGHLSYERYLREMGHPASQIMGEQA